MRGAATTHESLIVFSASVHDWYARRLHDVADGFLAGGVAEPFPFTRLPNKKVVTQRVEPMSIPTEPPGDAIRELHAQALPGDRNPRAHAGAAVVAGA